MVNPFEIMPVLALAAMIVFIPLLSDSHVSVKQPRRDRDSNR